MSDNIDTKLLLQRIQQLEKENKEARAKINLLEKRVQPNDPPVQLAPVNAHDFELEVKKEVSETRSDPFMVDGVEVTVVVAKSGKYAEIPGQAWSRLGFNFSLEVKNTTGGSHKFVHTTVEVCHPERWNANAPPRIIVKPEYQSVIVLDSSDAVQMAHMKNFLFPVAATVFTISVRVTVAIQTIDDVDPGPDAATVVVKGKEFSVSTAYLSHWSLYFRAYFKADMKEKQSGKYPIEDKDISAEDFEELLMVIYPTDKPISVHNFYKLLHMASRFEMPELTRRIECFLVDFEKNDLDRAAVFRIATDIYSLKLVQASLLHRWRDASLLLTDLLKSREYLLLKPETKVMVNERFARSSIDELYLCANNGCPPELWTGDGDDDGDDDDGDDGDSANW